MEVLVPNKLQLISRRHQKIFKHQSASHEARKFAVSGVEKSKTTYYQCLGSALQAVNSVVMRGVALQVQHSCSRQRNNTRRHKKYAKTSSKSLKALPNRPDSYSVRFLLHRISTTPLTNSQRNTTSSFTESITFTTPTCVKTNLRVKTEAPR